jgi:hypothetical protein
VHAWDRPDPLDPRRIDLERYRELMLRAAETIFLPLGLEPAVLRQLISSHAVAVPLPRPALAKGQLEPVQSYPKFGSSLFLGGGA